MKLNTYLRRIASWGLCLLICIPALTQTALAAKTSNPTEKLPLDKKCSLTLEFPCSGLPVELYQVASVDESVKFTPTDEFKPILEKINQDLKPKATADEWKTLASTLVSELPGSEIKPVKEGKTQFDNSSKKTTVKFSDLTPGLYLIKPKQTYKSAFFTYTTTPYLVCLPNWMKADGKDAWVADVEADFTKKVESEPNKDPGPEEPIDPGPDPEEPKPNLTSRRVAKVWLDEKGNPLNPQDHPVSIQVELWRDGTLYSTVTLNQSNGWSYSWILLDAKYEWTIREANVSGYKVSVSSDDGVNYKITNTRPDDPGDPDDPYTPPDDPPDNPDNPPDNPDDPDDPDGPPDEPDIPTPPIDIDDPDVPMGRPDLPKDPTDPLEIIEIDDMDVPLANLPQTGQLWWPVPLLAAGGVFLFLIGWVKHRGAQDEE